MVNSPLIKSHVVFTKKKKNNTVFSSVFNKGYKYLNINMIINREGDNVDIYEGYDEEERAQEEERKKKEEEERIKKEEEEKKFLESLNTQTAPQVNNTVVPNTNEVPKQDDIIKGEKPKAIKREEQIIEKSKELKV